MVYVCFLHSSLCNFVDLKLCHPLPSVALDDYSDMRRILESSHWWTLSFMFSALAMFTHCYPGKSLHGLQYCIIFDNVHCSVCHAYVGNNVLICVM